MNNFKYCNYKNKTLKVVKNNDILEYFDLEGNPIQLESLDELQETQQENSFVDNSTDTISFLSDIIKNYVHLNNEKEYTVLSSFVILSYAYDLFGRIPYLWLNASKGTGKTTTLNCLSKLVRNPAFASAYTGSSLYRLIDAESPTLLLDEAEDLDKRSPLKNIIIKILNSGYEKNGSVMLTEKYESKKFSTYSVKILAGINDMLDTIKDRSIKIKLSKADSQFDKKNILENHQAEIFELLAKKINSRIAELCLIINEPNILNLSDKFINRSYDKWFPILSITKVFGNTNLYNDLQIYAENEINESLQDELNSLENLVKSIVEDFYKDNSANNELELNGKYYFKTTTLLDYFEKYQPYKLFRNQGELTTYLKKLNISTDRRRYNHDVTSFYTFPKENFQHLKQLNLGKRAS